MFLCIFDWARCVLVVSFGCKEFAGKVVFFIAVLQLKVGEKLKYILHKSFLIRLWGLSRLWTHECMNSRQVWLWVWHNIPMESKKNSLENHVKRYRRAKLFTSNYSEYRTECHRMECNISPRNAEWQHLSLRVPLEEVARHWKTLCC